MTLLDPYHPDFVKDPYPIYATLRDQSPVFYDEEWRLTFFARHADVAAILRDRRFGRDFRQVLSPDQVDADLYRRIYPPQWPAWTYYVRESFIDLEPPRHHRLRRLVAQAFTRSQAEAFRPTLEADASRHMERLVEEGRMEAIADYATPIPLAMISNLMGIPTDDRGQLVEWSHAIVRVFDRNVTTDEGNAAERAILDFAGYLRQRVAERTARPGEDLVSSLILVEDGGERLTEDEIIGTAILVLNAGHEATVQAIGNAVLALARFPDEFQRLRRHPEMISAAVDELLRFDVPLQMFERWVLEDIEWNGHRLDRGNKVGLLLGSANHDTEAFVDPGRLDLARSNNPHVSFGAGVHRCVGEALAKVELEAAISVLASRVVSFELETEVTRQPSLIFRGTDAIPITLVA